MRATGFLPQVSRVGENLCHKPRRTRFAFPLRQPVAVRRGIIREEPGSDETFPRCCPR
jgi:hypothetical protein